MTWPSHLDLGKGCSKKLGVGKGAISPSVCACARAERERESITCAESTTHA